MITSLRLLFCAGLLWIHVHLLMPDTRNVWFVKGLVSRILYRKICFPQIYIRWENCIYLFYLWTWSRQREGGRCWSEVRCQNLLLRYCPKLWRGTFHSKYLFVESTMVGILFLINENMKKHVKPLNWSLL